MSRDDFRPCPCGSGKDSQWIYDGYGNPLARVCSRACEQKTLAKYVPDIQGQYHHDEPMEEDY